jgi:hypothetical protein
MLTESLFGAVPVYTSQGSVPLALQRSCALMPTVVNPIGVIPIDGVWSGAVVRI